MIKTTIITALEGLEEIAPVWRQLFTESKSEHIFQSFEWNYYWSKYMLGRYKINVILFWDNETVIAILPLVYRRQGLGWKKYEFMSVYVSNYHDIIIGDNTDPSIIRAALTDYISKNLGIFDLIELRLVPTGSKLSEIIRDSGGLNGSITVPHKPAFIIDMYLGLEGYIRERLPKKFRYDIQRQMRRLSESGRLKFIEVSDMSSMEGMLEALFRMKTAWAEQQGFKDSFFKNEDFRRFDRAVCGSFLNNGWLYAHMLEYNGTIIAANLDFKYNGHIYCHEISYDINFDKRFSPGRILQFIEIEKGFTNGYKDFDFAQGDVWYKRRWYNALRDTKRSYLFKGRAYLRRVFFKIAREYIYQLQKLIS